MSWPPLAEDENLLLPTTGKEAGTEATGAGAVLGRDPTSLLAITCLAAALALRTWSLGEALGAVDLSACAAGAASEALGGDGGLEGGEPRQRLHQPGRHMARQHGHPWRAGVRHGLEGERERLQ